MRTSFQHQSEAQSPNGPLTAATSPDTPSPCKILIRADHLLRFLSAVHSTPDALSQPATAREERRGSLRGGVPVFPRKAHCSLPTSQKAAASSGTGRWRNYDPKVVHDSFWHE